MYKGTLLCVSMKGFYSHARDLSTGREGVQKHDTCHEHTHVHVQAHN